jgi:virginiamycin B lyase
MRVRVPLALLASSVVAAGCAQGPSSLATSQTSGNGAGDEPFVLQGGGHTDSGWVSFYPHTTDVIYNGIVSGPERKIWFSVDGPSNSSGGIAKLDMSGQALEFPLPNLHPDELAVGADNDLYFDPGGAGIIGRLMPSGVLKVFTLPSGDCICQNGLTLGNDGNVWFSETNHVGYITPAGAITEYSNGGIGNYATGIAYGPDGNVWFIDEIARSIATLNPHTGAIKEFTVPGTLYPHAIVAGPDGNLWFTAGNAQQSQIGMITTQGTFMMYVVKTWVFSEPPHHFTFGPGGNIWFVGQATINGNLVNSVNRFDIKTGMVASHIPPAGRYPLFMWDIAAGPDGNLWVSNHAATINVFIYRDLDVSPSSLSFSGAGQSAQITVTESGKSTWTVKTTNPGVATVAHGRKAGEYVVTSTGVGTCKIVVADQLQNFFNVQVTVR